MPLDVSKTSFKNVIGQPFLKSLGLCCLPWMEAGENTIHSDAGAPGLADLLFQIMNFE